MISRRRLLQCGATLTTAGILTPARASITASKRKMIFVRVPGGWDTTRVFSPVFDNPQVDMEEAAELGIIGDLEYVAHPARPEVTNFFTQYGPKTAILNGLIIPSINHMICNRLLYTANSSATEPDWATRIAAAKANDYPLPHVLISGKAIGGHQNDLIIRVGDNGQLGKLISGELNNLSDLEVKTPTEHQSNIADLYLQQVLSLQKDAGIQPHFMETYHTAIERASLMQELSESIRWNTDGSDGSQIDLAIDLLLSDLTRCITVEFYRMSFDSHENNESKQNDNFIELFAFLQQLVSTLENTAGLYSDNLLEECTIVVLSEMGRTPHQNSSKGKEHWCHTAGMLIGSGVKGGRNYGGYSEYFYGQPINLQDAEISAGGQEITPKVLGATLLAMADIDPLESLGVEPIYGILE